LAGYATEPAPDPQSLFTFGSNRSLGGLYKCHCSITNQRWYRIRNSGIDSGRILRFFRTQIRSQKFVKKRSRIRGHFSISAVTVVCVVISYVKIWVNYGWISDCSRQPESKQESDSQIWKIAGPSSGPGFKSFGTGAESESGKWLRPPLLQTLLNVGCLHRWFADSEQESDSQTWKKFGGDWEGYFGHL